MTQREIKLTRAVLDYLHAADRGQRTEIQIHAGAFETFDEVAPSTAELTAVLKNCDAEKWIVGVPTRFRVMKWNITDAGESVRLEF